MELNANYMWGPGLDICSVLTITFPKIEDIEFNPGIFSGPYVFEFTVP